MAFPILRNFQRPSNFLLSIKSTQSLISNKSIMTSKQRLGKVLEELERNPFFDKYANKIAKLQQTSPEEFLKRIEEKEKKLQEEKVTIKNSVRHPVKCPWMLVPPKNKFAIQMRHFSMQEKQLPNMYISTPVFYVNASPHIGHLYSAILADSLSRYKSMLGHKTFLSTGTDEHGNKVEDAAKAAKMPVLEYCNQISWEYESMCNDFSVKYSTFIRTTEDRHKNAVQHFWKVLDEKGHIYSGKYSGWYCQSDEAFLQESELKEVQNPSGEKELVSIYSGNTVKWTEEENFKFRLSSFVDDLKFWLKDESTVRPAKYHKILCEMIEEGHAVEDLSITRPSRRVSWGIPCPSDPSQSIYVWLDALVNYLTCLGYPDDKYREFWPPNIQIIGKDILKFHGIYWPAFLMAAGLEPPKTLLCHSHWTVDGQKMSKSKRNVVSPKETAVNVTNEGLRYFLLREAVPHNDANYNIVKMERILNAELANTFGNLVSRCTGRKVNPVLIVPEPSKFCNSLQSAVALKLTMSLNDINKIAQENYESVNLHHVVDSVMNVLYLANELVDHHRPWQFTKHAKNTKLFFESKATVALALETARICALILYPIIPRTSTDLLNFLNVSPDERTWEDTQPLFHKDSPERSLGREGLMLFKKLNMLR